MLTAALAVGALASAPTASATGTNYTWAGADPTSPNWSLADNWSPAGAPSGAIGTLSFPDLGPTCDDGTSTASCYESNNDLGTQSANALSIDDDQSYNISSGTPLQLGSGGLTAGATEQTADNATGDPLLNFPIALTASQTWSIDGGAYGQGGGIAVPQITGSGALSLSLINGGTLMSGDLQGTQLTVTGGDGTGSLITEPLPGQNVVGLPSALTLDDGSSLYEYETATGDSLNVSGSVDAPPNVDIGYGAAPDATLSVNSGTTTFDQWTNLFLFLDDNDTAPGDGGFSQLNAVGSSVNLGGATLNLTQGWTDSNGDCTTLTPGDSFPVISSGYALSGDLTYYDNSGNFDTLSPGQTSQVVGIGAPSGCSTGDPATNALAVLTYLPDTIVAKIVGAPVDSSAPVISGTTHVGQKLTMTSNSGWGGSSPAVTGYSYQWLDCATNCTPISGATASTFTLTSAQAGDKVKLRVTATNSLGSTTADSSALGPVTGSGTQSTTHGSAPNSPNGPTTVLHVRSALDKLGHPSGARAISALIRTRSFKTRFTAPSAGSLRIRWTTAVSTGQGKHRKRHKLTVAIGSAHAYASGAATVEVHLRAAGRSLLERHRALISADEKFRPTGGSWVTVTRRFSL